MSGLISDALLTQFKSQISDWDTNRLKKLLESLLVRFKQSENDKMMVRAVRGDAVQVLFEILNYSQYLLISDIDLLFVQLLIELRRHGTKLRLQESIYSGILVLIVHIDESVRELGQAYLSTASTMLSDKEEAQVVPIMTAVFDQIRSIIDNQHIPKSYHFSKDISVLWAGVFRMIKYTSRLTVPSFVSKSAKDVDRLILDSFRAEIGQYWPRCKILEIVLKYTDCSWTTGHFDGEFATLVASTLLKDTEFNKLICTGDGEGQDEELVYHFEVVFGVLILLINLTQKSKWLVEPMKWVFRYCGRYNKAVLKCLKAKLETIVAMPIIDSELINISIPFLVGQGAVLPDNAMSELLLCDLKQLSEYALDTSGNAKLLNANLEVWKKLPTLHLTTEQIKSVLENVSLVSFLSLLDDPPLKTFSDLWNSIVKQTTRLFQQHYEKMTFKWEVVFRFYIFNDNSIQRIAEEKMLLDSGKESIAEAIEYYLRKHKSQFLETMFENLKEFKTVAMNGFVPIYSAHRILDWFTHCQAIYDIPSLDHQYQNFWIRLSIFGTNWFMESSKWLKLSGSDITEVKRLFVKGLRILRSFMKFKARSIRMSSNDVQKFHVEWIEDTIHSLLPWINLLDEDITFRSCELIIMMVKETKNIGKRNSILLTDLLINKKILDKAQERQIKLVVWETDKQNSTPSVVGAPAPESKSALSDTKRNREEKCASSPDLMPEKPQKVPRMEIPANNFLSHQPLLEKKPVQKIIAVKPNVPTSRLINTNNIAKKSTSVATKKMSTFDRLKTETFIEAKKSSMNVPPPKPIVSSIRRLESDELPDEPIRERRPVQEIVLPNVKQRATPIAVPTNDKNKQTREILNIDRLFERVLSWNTTDRDPKVPDIPEPQPIPDRFRSPNQYCSIFEPLLILEARSQFIKSCEELGSKSSFKLVLEGIAKIDSKNEISFSMSLNDYQKENWNENSLIYIENENRRSLIVKLNSTKKKKNDVMTLMCDVNLTKSRISSDIRPTSVWNAKLLMKMNTIVREYESMVHFFKMSLSNEILNPPVGLSYSGKYGTSEKYERNLGMNQPQANAISYTLSKTTGFVLIQGPPGSGKTKTILGLIAALQNSGSTIAVPTNYSGDRPKYKRKSPLLVCAPSNAAIDEIARRLMNGIPNVNGNMYKPSILRVGNQTSIHPDVVPVSLNYLVDKKMETDGGADERQSNRQELRMAQEALDRHRANKPSDYSSEYVALEAKLKKKLDALFKNRREMQKDFSKDRLRTNIEHELIANADIILTTLSGSGHDVFKNLNDIDFPTVIIDEACQAVELNVLIPLRLGCKRAILVGDPKQLPPTVLSQIAAKNNYETSLFQRLMKASPKSVNLLSIQYRMHPAISQFPGTTFYGSRLGDASGLEELRAIEWHKHSRGYFPPYMFYDAFNGREKRTPTKSLMNDEEINVCVRLIQNLAESFPSINFGHRIGVITFYKDQAYHLKNKLRREFGNDIVNYVDVNTVDGFQGQEKDIIILSCVRASRDSGIGFLQDERRLNVALTRARHSLLVLGHRQTLLSDKLWGSLVMDADRRRLIKKITPREIDVLDARTDNLFKDYVQQSKQ